MTAGPGGVWVDVPNMASVVRIDPATNKVGLLVPLDGHVASDGKEVWIGVDPGPDGLPEVVRIDPVSGKIITAVDLDTSGIGDLAVGLGSVWVITDSGLLRIDAATGQIVGRLDIGGDGGNVIVAGGSVWVTADGQPYVVRIRRSDRRPSPVDKGRRGSGAVCNTDATGPSSRSRSGRGSFVLRAAPAVTAGSRRSPYERES